MATMAENVIAAGSENRSPMLKKACLLGEDSDYAIYPRKREWRYVKLLPKITVKDTDGVTDIRHIAKQCITKKRMKDSEWFKDKMLLAQAQESGVVLNKEQHDFLADNLEETNDCEDLQLQATTNFKANHVDAYDSHCDDEATTNAIFMENLSPVGSLNDDTVEPRYDSDMLFKIPYYDTYYDSDMLNSNVQNNDMMLSVIKQMKSQVEKCNMVNQESKSVNESLTSELE
ncbi:hypothetical protein Tco_1218980 [Tanacetum coccineum]